MTDETPAEADAEGTQVEELCVALANYDPLYPDELRFQKGDLIHVTGKEETSSGFWRGYKSVDKKKKECRPALFPACFVSSHPSAVLHALTGSHSSTCPKYYENRALCMEPCIITRYGKEDVCERGDVLTVVRPSGRNKAGYWEVKDEKGNTFDCPSDKLCCNVVVVAHSMEFAGAESLSPLSPLQPRPEGLLGTSITAPPLEFHAGETILVHRRWSDGWWEGSVIDRNGPAKDRRGVFPSSFTVPNMSTTSPPLFCNECKGLLQAATAESHCSRCTIIKEVIGNMMQALKEEVPTLKARQTNSVDLFKYLSIQPKEASSASYESSVRIVV